MRLKYGSRIDELRHIVAVANAGSRLLQVERAIVLENRMVTQKYRPVAGPRRHLASRVNIPESATYFGKVVGDNFRTATGRQTPLTTAAHQCPVVPREQTCHCQVFIGDQRAVQYAPRKSRREPFIACRLGPKKERFARASPRLHPPDRPRLVQKLSDGCFKRLCQLKQRRDRGHRHAPLDLRDQTEGKIAALCDILQRDAVKAMLRKQKFGDVENSSGGHSS